MIRTQPSGDRPETTHAPRVAPEDVPELGSPFLGAALWWVLSVTAMVAGGSAAAFVLVAAGGTLDLSSTVAYAVAATVAATVAVCGGVAVFERLLGIPGAALGAGLTLQLIHWPLVELGVIPHWVAVVGWVLTAAAAGALTWRAHARRPPVIRTAEPVATRQGALAELAGTEEPASCSKRITVSGRFRVAGWPRAALQAVELPGNPPAEIDAVVSIETLTRRGTAFMICNDGARAVLVTNEHLCTGARTARVSIAGTIRSACVLPRPEPERFAQLLGGLVPQLDHSQRLRLAQETDLRLVRIDSSGLAVAPLEISTADTANALALSVGYPHGGIPRFVWPAHPVPLPAIGVGRLVVARGTAELWTSWRIQSGNSGGPVLVRERGRLRVGAVTYVQHQARRSRGNATHIPAPVLRAFVAAVEGGAHVPAADM